MEYNLIISGLIKVKGENCIAKVQNFFKDKLSLSPENGANIGIVSAFHIGHDNNRLMVVKLQRLEDKRLILRHKANLYNQRNTQGCKFFVDEQLPESLMEEKKKNQQIIAANKKKPLAQQSKMEIVKGHLIIEGTPY